MDEPALEDGSPGGCPNSTDPFLGATPVHSGGFNAAFADGSVKFIKATTKPETLKALITINGGEIIPPGQY